jgi:hypothetical protein
VTPEPVLTDVTNITEPSNNPCEADVTTAGFAAVNALFAITFVKPAIINVLSFIVIDCDSIEYFRFI